MKHLKTLLLPFAVLAALYPLKAQPDYPKTLTTLQVPEHQIIQIADLQLIGSYFLPGAENKLYSPSQEKVFDIVTKTVSTRARQKTDPLSAWQRVYVPEKSSDPHWANIRISKGKPLMINQVRREPQLLVINGTDSLHIPVGIRGFPNENFSYNYPYLWLSMNAREGETDFQLIKRYGAQNHVVTEYPFSLPDLSEYGGFPDPPCHDRFKLWYNHVDGDLFAFDKRDSQIYHYPFGIRGNWAFLGRDSALLYLYDSRAGKLLALNKQWLEQKKVLVDCGKVLRERLAFDRLRDSVQLAEVPDLSSFLQSCRMLLQAFGTTDNVSIQTALNEIPDLLRRRLYGDADFAKKSNEQFPGLEEQLEKNLLSVVYDWQMEYCIMRGDLDGYAAFYDKIRQLTPDHFQPGESGLELLDMGCVSKRLAAQRKWQEIKQIKTAPDEQLWEKGALVEELFSGGVCQLEIERGAGSERSIKPVAERLPAAWVYAELVREFPASAFAGQAVCKITAFNQGNTRIPTEILEAAATVTTSPCKSAAETALFWRLAYDFTENRRAKLLQARALGRQLLQANPDLPAKTEIESMLQEIEAELDNPDGN